MTQPSGASFLTLAQFTAMWDGAPLSVQQQAMVSLLLQVASGWVLNQSPGRPLTDPAAQFVVYDVVSNAARYQKYGKLATFSKTTGHRTDAGSFDSPMKALEFTDTHKQLLGLPLAAAPMSSCVPNDFAAADGAQGWPTAWSQGNDYAEGWNFWELNDE